MKGGKVVFFQPRARSAPAPKTTPSPDESAMLGHEWGNRPPIYPVEEVEFAEWEAANEQAKQD